MSLFSSHTTGQVVDQDALVQALQAGTIRAAALDVTYPEPLPRSQHTIKLISHSSESKTTTSVPFEQIHSSIHQHKR